MAEQSAVRVGAGAVAITTSTVLPVFLLGALSVQIGAELHFDPAALGLVVALYFGVSALASLPVGKLVERWGSRRTSRVAVCGAAGFMLLTGLVPWNYASLVAILLCGAWCNVMGQLSSNLTLARSMPEHRMGLSFGVKQASVPLATLLAGVAVPAVALTVGWRWAFVIAAGLALTALAAAPRGSGPATRDRAVPEDRATGSLAVIGAAAGLGAAAATGLGIFLVSAAVDQGVDPGTGGLVLTLGSVVGLVMRMLHGHLADRRSGAHIAFVAGSLLSGAVGLALLAVPGPVTLIAGVVLGFGLGWSWPGLLQYAVVRLNPSAPAAATAIVQVGVYAGGFVGPIGFGFLATHASFTVAWFVSAAAMLVAGAGVLVGRRMLVAHRVAQERRSASAIAS
ncbi:MFS transporter [Pseudonocardia oroxyli]|uniref:Predicted arabinose efflux permease, MFS family n=1 Tax=Pseudonocardia oroxyli TaxID=366584 RepID=A0A1G7RH80_PSEOR|nr:MFS transporter [Pseudonocardia oroxyli]SDG10137.1 Predicted arabinose efflux permease, MFS family [Pseudonocardia oroxyli]